MKSSGTDPDLTFYLNIIAEYKNSSVGRKLGIAELNYTEPFGYTLVTAKNGIEIFLGNGTLEQKMALLDKYQEVIDLPGGQIRYILANDDRRIIVGYRSIMNNGETKT